MVNVLDPNDSDDLYYDFAARVTVSEDRGVSGASRTSVNRTVNIEDGDEV